MEMCTTASRSAARPLGLPSWSSLLLLLLLLLHIVGVLPAKVAHDLLQAGRGVRSGAADAHLPRHKPCLIKRRLKPLEPRDLSLLLNDWEYVFIRLLRRPAEKLAQKRT